MTSPRRAETRGRIEGVCQPHDWAGPIRPRRLATPSTTHADTLGSHAEGAVSRAARLAFRQSQRRDGAAVAPMRRVLVIDERLPTADINGDARGTLSHMLALRRLGYAVSFAATSAARDDDGGIAALARAGIVRCGAPVYASVEDVFRREAGTYDLIVLHGADIAERYLALARNCAPGARIVYSVVDLHHVRLERQAEVEQSPDLLEVSRRLRTVELLAAWSADAVITYSTREADLLRRALPQTRVHAVPWDVTLRPPPAPFATRRGLAFIGDFACGHNEDAAHWLVGTVLPLVWAVDPTITCRLVGRDMSAGVRGLARPRVLAMGRVADLGLAVFDQVRLTVAPLRYGAGIKGKVLDSLAAGVPCAMTPIAAEGLTSGPALNAMIAGDAPGLARLICRLHGQEAANHAAAKAGVALIRKRFSVEPVTAALRAAIGEGASPKDVGRAVAAVL